MIESNIIFSIAFSLWVLLSHQLSNNGLNFNLLEGKIEVKEFIVNLFKSQESLEDYKDACRFMARVLGLGGLDTVEQLLEDP